VSKTEPPVIFYILFSLLFPHLLFDFSFLHGIGATVILVPLLKSPYLVRAASLWALLFGVFHCDNSTPNASIRWACFAHNGNFESIRCHTRRHYLLSTPSCTHAPPIFAKLILKIGRSASDRHFYETIVSKRCPTWLHEPPTSPIFRCHEPSLSPACDIHTRHTKSAAAASHWISASAVRDLVQHHIIPQGCMVAWVCCVPLDFPQVLFYLIFNIFLFEKKKREEEEEEKKEHERKRNPLFQIFGSILLW